ncbi:CMP-N-acetylneuraminate-beta-galactosamide-alpha-2,3-sialyltransferase 4 isoform X8 [Aquila chrysaetos chrysaetos]|uniref:CMP-N-acetylneuraminate-beta-galactosamide- alpha-2,3-sialyltransferase 4 isoform X8 n=1 Tax=Aquila chrysaetos chrysaetos TaxID=223781 RepID=UPI0011771122|nr:CMP-N-acetylneuraminate-beta-galactosamide-alpha-2,3-sialyltransferase 4 isoform X8 [Aquila chrysaetos chrysaetos]
MVAKHARAAARGKPPLLRCPSSCYRPVPGKTKPLRLAGKNRPSASLLPTAAPKEGEPTPRPPAREFLASPDSVRGARFDGGREDGLVDPAELLPGLRGQTVTSGSRDESSGPRLMPLLLIKMINKSRGKILGVLALFLVMVWYSIYREDRYIQLFYFPVQENKTMCPLGEVEKKAAQLIGNYTRDHPLFLQLKDYFWVKTPSPYELPYGTKGSEDVLLRLLSITHYSLPESIQSLKCRRCAVVGNGHRLRNSSMGETINTYDVVIRLNNAPVHGYEQDVGSKTTMRLFYPESAHFNPRTENNPDTLLVLVPFKPMDFQWMEAILNDKKRVRKGFWRQPPLIWDANPERVRILNPYYMEVTAAKLLNLPMKQPRKVKQKPTTGLLAITLALHFCDLVHIAGFGYPDSANKKQTIHYYEQITLKSMAASEHNVSHEAVAIKRMLELGLVKNLTYF